MNTDIITEPLEFMWDEGNKEKNFKKHGVKNEESESVFLDRHSVLAEDLKHSNVESRYQILGVSDSGKFLSIFFTIRTEKIRIISARGMNTKERNFYNERQKTKANT